MTPREEDADGGGEGRGGRGGGEAMAR